MPADHPTIGCSGAWVKPCGRSTTSSKPATNVDLGEPVHRDEDHQGSMQRGRLDTRSYEANAARCGLGHDVLVAEATSSSRTPLFARAAAAVTDGGTLATHASLVAREYGIPAVVGTGDATIQLHTGQTVIVDGTAGSVTPATLNP